MLLGSLGTCIVIIITGTEQPICNVCLYWFVTSAKHLCTITMIGLAIGLVVVILIFPFACDTHSLFPESCDLRYGKELHRNDGLDFDLRQLLTLGVVLHVLSERGLGWVVVKSECYVENAHRHGSQ